MSVKVVKEWVLKADQDYTVAKTLLGRRTLKVKDAICFHAQQCVEKYLKAYLTMHTIRFPKSHSLENLSGLASTEDKTFEFLTNLVRPLSKYAVGFRYPGDEAHRPEARQAVRVMEEARAFIRGRL